MRATPKICILSFSEIAWDARVLREIDAASRYFQVDVIGFGSYTAPQGVRYYPVSRRKLNPLVRIPLFLGGALLPKLWDLHYWQTEAYRAAYKQLLTGSYDLIHCNDWDSLPVAARAARHTGARLLFDAHEYTPGLAVARSRAWLTIPYRMHHVSLHQPAADAMITVSEGLQELYRANYHWEAELIRNAPPYQQVDFRPVDPQRIQLVHHGSSVPMRRIDSIIDMMPLLDSRFHLTLILMLNDPANIQKLKEQAQRLAPGRVTFLPPVDPSHLVNTVSQYDIGIPLLVADHVSYENALPNKFFDYLMAGLCISVTPLRIMKKYVDEYSIGVVAPERTAAALAASLNALTAEQIDRCKRNALKLACQMNAETEMAGLMDIYRRLLSRPARSGRT